MQIRLLTLMTRLVEVAVLKSFVWDLTWKSDIIRHENKACLRVKWVVEPIFDRILSCLVFLHDNRDGIEGVPQIWQIVLFWFWVLSLATPIGIRKYHTLAEYEVLPEVEVIVLGSILSWLLKDSC